MLLIMLCRFDNRRQVCWLLLFFFFKQKTAYEMRISDWSSDVCSSDLLLREVGLFDERYFAYCEEADLALRAKAQGWETGLVRGAIVVNPHMGTPSRTVDYLQLRNTLLLVREHSGRYHATIRGLLAVGQLVSGLLRPTQRGPYWDPGARVRALVDHCRGRYGSPPPAILTR